MAQALIDNFDSYSTGELAGQGGWTALTTNGFFNVSATNPQTSPNDVTNNGSVGNKLYYKAATNVAQSGTQTFYVCFSASPTGTNALGIGAYFFSDTPTGTDPTQGGNAPWLFRIYAFSTSTTLYDIVYTDNNGHSGNIVTGLSISTSYHKVEVTFNGATPTVNVLVDGANSTTFAPKTFTSLAVIGIVTSNNGASDVARIDSFGGVASGPANLKTWNGLAKASIKTINGLAIASVKTFNGLA